MQNAMFTRKEAVECTVDGVLRVPEGKTVLDSEFAYFVVREDLPRVHTLIIPKTVTLIESMRGDMSEGPFGYAGNPFSKIIVEEGNKNYKSVDGVLFSKDMKRLICYPCGKNGEEYTVPDGVEIIEEDAFLNVEKLRKIYGPKTLKTVCDGAFVGSKILIEPK